MQGLASVDEPSSWPVATCIAADLINSATCRSRLIVFVVVVVSWQLPSLAPTRPRRFAPAALSSPLFFMRRVLLA